LSSTSPNFDASASATGYLYQCRYALLLLLQRSEPDAELSLECLDDIAFEKRGDPLALIQTKHRAIAGVLTDGSTDLWKTLRVWCEKAKAGEIALETCVLSLVTTASAPAGSAASFLRDVNRNPEKARKLLEAAAERSQAGEDAPIRKCFRAFDQLPVRDRKRLLACVTVIDGAPTITDLDARLRKELCRAVAREHLDAFIERLEGWWWGQVVQRLSGADGSCIRTVDLDGKMNELRDGFRSDSLPIDFHRGAEPEGAPPPDSIFIRQLGLIEIDGKLLVGAIRDYQRAFVQRSRWLRDKLLARSELERYEDTLIEEWERQFERLVRRLPAAAVEADKVRLGQDLLAWAETLTGVYLRPRCQEPWVLRGTFHMLADREYDALEVGWHPEFRARLAALLGLGDGKK
jgi:hypothetical protein